MNSKVLYYSTLYAKSKWRWEDI